MRETISMSKKVFYTIVGLCTIIIMSNSIEAFIKAKDVGLFETWISNPSLNIDKGQTIDQMYSIYLTMCLALFLIRVITPVALAINSYFSFIKIKVNKIFVLIWMVLIIGLFPFTSIREAYFSVFFIISGICYLGLIYVLIHLWKEINKQRNINLAKTT